MKSNGQEIESLAKEIGALSQLAEQRESLEEKIELAEEILGAKKSSRLLFQGLKRSLKKQKKLLVSIE